MTSVSSVRPGSGSLRGSRRLSGGRLKYSMDDEDEQPSDGKGTSFGRAVDLFNGGEYCRCHDFLEELWYDAEEPIRTLLHGILQCAVGLHHLFNRLASASPELIHKLIPEHMRR